MTIRPGREFETSARGFLFARALGLSWGASVFAGVAYELTGIVASQMSPAHDGKLFVSALTPLSFWTLLHAIRDEQRWAFGAFAIVVALIILGHYHMAYFLLIALGLWAVFLAFLDPKRTPERRSWMGIAFATLAVVVGFGITGLQILPFFEYIKYSPRVTGGPNTGWEFATSYAFPPAELVTTGARQVDLVFDSAAYSRGKMLSLGVLLVAITMLAAPSALCRRARSS